MTRQEIPGVEWVSGTGDFITIMEGKCNGCGDCISVCIGRCFGLRKKKAYVRKLESCWEMGIRKAKEFLFTGDFIDANEAHRLGVVNRVVPRDKLEEAVMELANKIALMPPVALSLTKKSLNRTQDIQGYTQSMSAHFDIHMLAHGSDETVAFIESAVEKGATGTKAFTELRDGKFKEE